MDGFATIEANGPCPLHPARPRLGTCSRCGAFICIECCPDLASDVKQPCAKCRQLLKVADAPRGRRAAYNAACGAALFFGISVLALDSKNIGVALVLAALPVALGVLALVTRWSALLYAYSAVGSLVALLHLPSPTRVLLLLSFALAPLPLLRESRGEPPDA